MLASTLRSGNCLCDYFFPIMLVRSVLCMLLRRLVLHISCVYIERSCRTLMFPYIVWFSFFFPRYLDWSAIKQTIKVFVSILALVVGLFLDVTLLMCSVSIKSAG